MVSTIFSYRSHTFSARLNLISCCLTLYPILLLHDNFCNRTHVNHVLFVVMNMSYKAD